MSEHSKLPLTFSKLNTDKTINYGSDQHAITRGSTYICTANSQAHAELIVDSVNKVKRMEKALKELENYTAGSGNSYLLEMNEIAKNALKADNQ